MTLNSAHPSTAMPLSRHDRMTCLILIRALDVHAQNLGKRGRVSRVCRQWTNCTCDVARFFSKGFRGSRPCHLSRWAGRVRSCGDAERCALQKPSAMAPATAGQRAVLKGVYPRHFFQDFISGRFAQGKRSETSLQRCEAEARIKRQV